MGRQSRRDKNRLFVGCCAQGVDREGCAVLPGGVEGGRPLRPPQGNGALLFHAARDHAFSHWNADGIQETPPDGASTVTRGQFAALCEAFKSAGGSQDDSAPLFEVKASAAGAGGDGLYVKEDFQAPVALPVFGEAMLLGDERLTPEFCSEHRGRLINTAWFVQADEADKVSSDCVALDLLIPPPPGH